MDREIEVAGKKVVFKERLSWSEMFRHLNAPSEEGVSATSVSRQFDMLIESWEFEGEPGDSASWDADAGYEILAIFQASTEYFRERTFVLGNSTSASSETST